MEERFLSADQVTRSVVCVETSDEEAVGVVEAGKAARAGFHFRGGSRLRVFRYAAASSGSAAGAVVLLHGLLASHRAWEDVALSLAAEGYQCYVPDLLGFGDSPWPLWSASYSIDCHVDAVERDVLGVVKADGHTHVHFVGHSLGAVIATELAIRPDVAALSLAVVALPYFSSARDAKRVLRARPACCCGPPQRQGWRASAVWLVLDFPLLSFILCSLICQQRGLFVVLAALGDKLRPTRRRPMAVKVADALNHSYFSVLASYRRCVENHRLRPHALRSTLPVLVAHGRHDDVVPSTCSSDFHGDLQRCRNSAARSSSSSSSVDAAAAVKADLVILDDVKHSCHDAAAPLGHLLGGWLARVGDADADATDRRVTSWTIPLV